MLLVIGVLILLGMLAVERYNTLTGMYNDVLQLEAQLNRFANQWPEKYADAVKGVGYEPATKPYQTDKVTSDIIKIYSDLHQSADSYHSALQRWPDRWVARWGKFEPVNLSQAKEARD